MRLSFAERLNRLFDTVYPPGRRPYSSAEVVAGFRERGMSMSAPYLSQLRSGKRDNPSAATMATLAKFFGVDPAYFTDDEYADRLDEELKALSRVREHRVRLPSADPSSSTQSHGKHRVVDDAPTADTVAFLRLDITTLADRLNKLFDTTLKPSGVPYSSEEVASALQEDGLPIPASLISRLRSGTGELPGRPTLEAIAFFFDVSPDCFTEDSHSQGAHDLLVTSEARSGHSSAHSSARGTDVASSRMRFDDIGRCVSGLAESSIRYLDAQPPDLDRARRLMALASDLGIFVSRSDGEFVDVPRSLRSALSETWP
jgi:hypothetical protein